MGTFSILADATVSARNDPTWIYSTIAQTAGAIVGLLGAILISRVISQMTLAQPIAADLRVRIDRILVLLSGVNSTIAGRQNETSFDVVGMAWYAKIADCHQQVLKAFVGEVRRGRLHEHTQLLRECVTSFPSTANKSLLSNDLRDAMKAPIEQLDSLRAKIEEFDQQLVPPALRKVLWLLAFLSLTGVAWPLIELSLLTETPPRMFALVFIFSLGVLALIAYFFQLLWELKSLSRFHWKRVVR